MNFDKYDLCFCAWGHGLCHFDNLITFWFEVVITAHHKISWSAKEDSIEFVYVHRREVSCRYNVILCLYVDTVRVWGQDVDRFKTREFRFDYLTK